MSQYVRKSYTKNQMFISKIDRWQQRVLILGFYKGKLAKNEPDIGNFQNLPKTDPIVIFI